MIISHGCSSCPLSLNASVFIEYSILIQIILNFTGPQCEKDRIDGPNMRPSKATFKKQLPQKPHFTKLSDHTNFCMDLLGDLTALVLPKLFLLTQDFTFAQHSCPLQVKTETTS